MTRRLKSGRLGGVLAAATACASLVFNAGVAVAQPDHAPCFYIDEWHGWKSPSPTILYLAVNLHDVYKADLSVGSSQLDRPDVHLISRMQGHINVCSALDLQLELADSHGYSEPLIVTKLVKLSPDEVAAIPQKYRPH